MHGGGLDVASLAAFSDPFQLVLVLFDLGTPLAAEHFQSQPAAQSFDRTNDGQLRVMVGRRAAVGVALTFRTILLICRTTRNIKHQLRTTYFHAGSARPPIRGFKKT